MIPPFSKINLNQPWLQHLSQQVDHNQLKQADNLVVFLNDILNKRDQPIITGLGKPLQFISQQALPVGEAYESHIAKTGQVPTRNNLHDGFNAWVWLTLPKTKAVLNAYQYNHIAQFGIGNQRTKLRDALTLFDENAAILVTSDSQIKQALFAFDWQNALVHTRTAWENPMTPVHSKPNQSPARACLYVFGHALMEQLTKPRKPLCAHTWAVLVSEHWFAQSTTKRLADLDQYLEQDILTQITSGTLTPRYFQPLPILGVPHFWAANADPKFYDDTFVFRTGRRGR